VARKKGLRPLVKDPLALLSAEWFAQEFGADVVVIVRHPAAFVSSLVRLQWSHPFDDFLRQDRLLEERLSSFAAEINEFAHRPREIIEQGILLWRILYSVVGGYADAHPEWTFVRHEDVSATPEHVFAAL
jgi:hypothetical protein